MIALFACDNCRAVYAYNPDLEDHAPTCTNRSCSRYGTLADEIGVPHVTRLFNRPNREGTDDAPPRS